MCTVLTHIQKCIALLWSLLPDNLSLVDAYCLTNHVQVLLRRRRC